MGRVKSAEGTMQTLAVEMYAALICAAERGQGIRITTFEQAQLKAIRDEFDRAHAERTAPATRATVTASPTRLSSKSRT